MKFVFFIYIQKFIAEEITYTSLYETEQLDLDLSLTQLHFEHSELKVQVDTFYKKIVSTIKAYESYLTLYKYAVIIDSDRAYFGDAIPFKTSKVKLDKGNLGLLVSIIDKIKTESLKPGKTFEFKRKLNDLFIHIIYDKTHLSIFDYLNLEKKEFEGFNSIPLMKYKEYSKKFTISDYLSPFSVLEKQYPIMQMFPKLIGPLKNIEQKYWIDNSVKPLINIEVIYAKYKLLKENLNNLEIDYRHLAKIVSLKKPRKIFNQFCAFLPKLFTLFNANIQLYEARYGEFQITEMRFFDKTKRIFIFHKDNEMEYLSSIKMSKEKIDLVKKIINEKTVFDKDSLSNLFDN